ncbi:MAG: tetratricopeptide repeat protein [Steroidobacteraceae bacterium]
MFTPAAVTPNKQLQRTVIFLRVRAASAPFHCAHAARWIRGRAAAERGRWAALTKAAISTFLRVLVFVAISVQAMAASSEAELFRKLITLAERGSAPAQYNLGMLYNNGIGTTKDPRTAFRWFEKAAAAGDALASYKVGCYYAGQFVGVVPEDHEKALAAKLVAARAGYSRAQLDVGNAYARNSNFAEAAKWWTLAANQGDAQSLVNLSEVYRRGEGAQKSPAKALELTLIATRVVPSDLRTPLQSRISSLRNEATAAQVVHAEKAASDWRPKITSLSARADLGIEEARKLVQ